MDNSQKMVYEREIAKLKEIINMNIVKYELLARELDEAKLKANEKNLQLIANLERLENLQQKPQYKAEDLEKQIENLFTEKSKLKAKCEKAAMELDEAYKFQRSEALRFGKLERAKVAIEEELIETRNKLNHMRLRLEEEVQKVQHLEQDIHDLHQRNRKIKENKNGESDQMSKDPEPVQPSKNLVKFDFNIVPTLTKPETLKKPNRPKTSSGNS
jgi:chromosome segregation ATPase